MAEQLFATDVRFFAETSAGNATPSGDVIVPPFNNCVASRQSKYLEEKVSPFRAPTGRESVLEFFVVNFECHATPDFLGFLLEPHLTGGAALDWRSPEPTFALQIEAEDGDLIEFAGLALRDLQLSFVGRGVANMAVTLYGFTRTTGVSLQTVSASLDTEPIPDKDSEIILNEGPFDPFPYASNRVDALSAEYYLRRDVEVSQFDAFGTPSRHDFGPWKFLGEIVTPAEALTETATGTKVDGSVGFVLGPTGANLSVFADDSVRFLSQTDPVKADDFRDYRLIWEGELNDSGQLFTYSNSA